MIELIGLIFALIVFLLLTIKGWNICCSVLLSIVIIALTNGMNFFNCIAVYFAKGLGDFAGQWWLLFVLGAIYGKIMQKSGMSKRIAELLLHYFPKQRIFVILLVSALMSYGGIGTFIIAFTIYPIAVEIFEKTNISVNLLPATILFCPTTICMTMLPGTPSVQNIIPAKYLGTSIYSAPVMGISASLICFVLGYVYLMMQVRRSSKGANADIVHVGAVDVKKGILALLPCITLWLTSFIAIKKDIESQTAVEIAIFVGIVVCAIISRFEKEDMNIRCEVEEGVKSGLLTVMITSCIMGYGAVVKSSYGFEKCISYFTDMNNSPILLSVVIINVIALITGSSAGSLTLFFENFQEILWQSKVNIDQIHRIVTIASGGMDSMPYATGIVVTNDLAKTKMKDSYIHIFVTCAMIPLITLAMILIGMHILGRWF